jgi:prefoldin subunit 5
MSSQSLIDFNVKRLAQAKQTLLNRQVDIEQAVKEGAVVKFDADWIVLRNKVVQAESEIENLQDAIAQDTAELNRVNQENAAIEARQAAPPPAPPPAPEPAPTPAPAPTNDTAANRLDAVPPAPRPPPPPASNDPSAVSPPPALPPDTLTEAEQANLSGNQVPGLAAITNNYDLGPAFSTSSEIGNSVPGQAAITDNYSLSPNFAGSSQAKSAGSTANPDAVVRGPLINPLHSYASYTYGISLHMLTADEYNKVVFDHKFEPNRVIIASGGRHNNSQGATMFKRAPYFDVDFYFEDLNLQTVIGLNENNRATNAIDISFNIIEPYGVTLFNRIIKLTNEINPDSENYLEQPYLLQIDFFGMDDTGAIIGVIPGQTKRIPIRILSFDIKVSGKGAEYNIKASPYNHSAFDASSVSTPAHFEVKSGGVAAFFRSTEAEVAATKAKINQQRESEEKQNLRNNTGSEGGYIPPDGQITYVNPALISSTTKAAAAGIATGDPIYTVKSYGSAINAWQSYLEQLNKITTADKYYFEFPTVTLSNGTLKSVGNGNFILSDKLGAKNTPMVDVTDTAAHRKGTGLGIEILAIDYKTKIFSINTGTSIEQVLNYVIRNSSYILDQMSVPEEFTSPEAYVAQKKKYEKEPLLWYKIIPTIKLNKFDKIRKQWARDITYVVVPYEVYNTKSSTAPQGQWNDPLKVYDYIYTGKNVDILDFDIQFNALYYTAVTAYRGNFSAIKGMSAAEEQKVANPETYDGIPNPANAIMPIKEKPQTFDSKARATGGSNTVTAAAAVDTEQSLYSSAGGDMLQAELKIIGDPMYIKQDDVFYSPVSDAINKSSGDPRLIADGSLRMDNREVYIQITYRTPSDIDESTGEMRFDSTFLQSLFSGMYKVLTVNSTFSGGQFVQTLSTVRLHRQDSLENNGKPAGVTNERNVDSKIIPAVQPAAAPAAAPPPESTAPAIDETAPKSTPVQDTEPPVTTPEQAKLAAVNETAEEKPITQATVVEAPAENPPPPSPSPEKLAQKERVDALEVIKDKAASELGVAGSQVEELESQIQRLRSRAETLQRRIDTLPSTSALREEALSELPGIPARIASLEAQQSAAQAEFNRLRPISLKAFSDHAEAVRALSVMA